MKHLASLCAAPAAAISLAMPTPAWSEPTATSPSFQWSAPASCPNEAQVARDLERLLGRSLPEDRRNEVIASAVVTRVADGGFLLRVVLDTPQGRRERKLQHPSACGPLASAAAVLIAIALDPDLVERLGGEGEALAPPDAQAGPQPEIAPPNQKLPEPAKVNDQVERPTSSGANASLRLGVRADGGLSTGELPHAGWRAGGAVALVAEHWRVEGTFAYWFPQSVRLDGALASGGDFRLWAGGLRGCLPVRLTRSAELRGCGGLELGQEISKGIGLDAATNARDMWVAVVLAPALSVALSHHVGLFGAIEGAIPLHRTQFVVENYGPVYRTLAFTPRLLIGLELNIP